MLCISSSGKTNGKKNAGCRYDSDSIKPITFSRRGYRCYSDGGEKNSADVAAGLPHSTADHLLLLMHLLQMHQQHSYIFILPVSPPSNSTTI